MYGGVRDRKTKVGEKLLLNSDKKNGTKTHFFSLFFREKVRFRAKIFNLAADVSR